MALYYFLISTYTHHDVLAHQPKGDVGKGVYMIEIDQHGNSRQLDLLQLEPNIAFIHKHPELQEFYMTTETIKQQGEIIQVEIDPKMKIKNRFSSFGKSTCYLETPDNDNLYVTNYWDGSIVNYQIMKNGSLYNPQKKIIANSDFVEKNEPTREYHWKFRQKWPHAHCIVTEPYSCKKTFVVDLGSDKIFYYHRLNNKLEMFGEILLPQGYGPRHLVFHPILKIAYLVNELNSSISVFKYQNNTISEKYIITESSKCVNSHFYQLANLSCLPKDFDNELVNTGNGWKAKSHVSEIRLHPTLNFLYVSNRGHDSICLFWILENGLLSYRNNYNSGGKTPRNFNITRDGRLMLVANQDSNNYTIFSINQKDGSLRKLSSSYIPSPNFVFILN